jgi:Tol biopolymer transport system component
MRSLAIDSTISHYRIKELIGRGGMGEVYKAVDIQLGRVVALKTLLSEKAADEDARRRFLREARAASILSHPSICTIYEVGQEGDVAFISMQYLEGNTIHDILAKGPLRIEDALSYALDIADALDEAHRNGVIHRDIKPSNIIVNERGLAVVLDFGLAKQVGYLPAQSEDTPTLLQVTTTATIVGTVPYMSPEQLRGEALDARSDIFSFGSTLYETLTGKLPFNGRSPIDVTHSILHSDPTPIHQARMDLDAELDAIVRKALQKEPDARYPSASELKADLAGYIQRKGLAVKSISSESSARVSTAQTQRFPTGRLGLTTGRTLPRYFSTRNLLILLLPLILIGAIWWFLVRPRSGSDSELISGLRHVQLANWKSEAGESHSDGTFSRDGTKIAFSSTKDGKWDISITQTMGGDPVQLTKDEFSNRNPIWSPDGGQIAFVSRRGKEIGIWRVQAVGGTPTSIAFLGNFTPQLKYWSKDGATIYYRLEVNFFALDVASGQVTPVTNFEPDHFRNFSNMSMDADFSISPDEDRIAYIDVRDGQPDIWVMPMRGGPSVRITNDPAQDRNPVWHPDGKRIIYSSNRDGTFQVCVAYLDGRKPQQITFGDADSFVSDVSTDGKKILYGALRDESDIYAVTVDAGEERQITSDVGCELWPDISPDGKSVAFQAARDLGQIEDSAILTRSIEGDSRQIRLAGAGIDPTWSPDGRRLAFLRSSKDAWNIWTVRPTGGDERQIANHNVHVFGFTSVPLNRMETRYYSWSPDGSKLIYASKESEEFSLWTVSYDGSSETRISSTNSDTFVLCPLWSPDGDRIAYVSRGPERGNGETPDGGKMIWKVWVKELATGKLTIIYQADSVLLLLGWSGSAGSLLLASAEAKSIAPSPTSVSLIGLSVTGAARTSIAHFQSTYLYNTHLSPDGRTIAFVSRQGGRDNVWLIPATGGEARKITRNPDARLYYSSLTWSRDGRAIYFGKQSRGSLISIIDNFR